MYHRAHCLESRGSSLQSHRGSQYALRPALFVVAEVTCPNPKDDVMDSCCPTLCVDAVHYASRFVVFHPSSPYLTYPPTVHDAGCQFFFISKGPCQLSLRIRFVSHPSLLYIAPVIVCTQLVAHILRKVVICSCLVANVLGKVVVYRRLVAHIEFYRV